MYENEAIAPVRPLFRNRTLVGCALGIDGSCRAASGPGPGDQGRPGVGAGRAPGLVEERGDLRVVVVVVVLICAGQRDRGQQRGRVGVVAVVHRDEAVDALARLRGGEEVDVVVR